MKKHSYFPLLAFALLLFLTGSVFSKDTTASGENLEQALFMAVKEQNWQAVEDKIAPFAQSVNADKVRNRTELINYIKNLKFDDFQFSNFNTTQNEAGNVLVVTYTFTYRGKIGSKQVSGQQIKNLSIWENINGKWQWIAHAVID